MSHKQSQKGALQNAPLTLVNQYKLAQTSIAYRRFSFFFKPLYAIFLWPVPGALATVLRRDFSHSPNMLRILFLQLFSAMLLQESVYLFLPGN